MKTYLFKNIISLFAIAFLAISTLFGNTPPEKKENITVHPPSLMSCIGNSGSVNWLIYEGIIDDELPYLYHAPNYPYSPNRIIPLLSLASPSNYNNNYGSLIRGFIQAPETGSYMFNLTGDDDSKFFLSTDSMTANITEIAYIDGWTDEDEHDKYPSQTSSVIQLEAGEFYYFETHQKEGGGGDFIRGHWKTPSTINSPEWEVIHGIYLYDYVCDLPCPVKGTACDDSDPTTINDQEDGACNCAGTPSALPFPCIGDRGSLTALYYDNISGSEIDDLTSHVSYPDNPTRFEDINMFLGPTTTGSQYGTRVRGYLRAPATGNYTFNITGNNEVSLLLSSAEVPNPATDQICFIDGDTGRFDHEDEPTQTSTTIMLTEGQFYSIELLHKESFGSDYFYVFWKTPYQTDTLWRVLDGSFLYKYKEGCGTTCMPEGVPCDDGDPQTFSDAYDANCNCVGIPCSDPACTNSLGYTPYDECDKKEEHSTNSQDSWTSCEPTQSPNPARGMSHWVQYDFGGVFTLNASQIWNYNVAGASGQGFQNVAIDYSTDGVEWIELGTFNWAQASGTTSYTGFDFPEINGARARYLLFTGLDNFDGSACMGISEVSFSALQCSEVGLPCDDGDPLTMDDSYDIFCNCNGTPELTNSCGIEHRLIHDIPLMTGNYDAEKTITSKALIDIGSNVNYVAGESITLDSGFYVKLGAVFYGTIAPCVPPEPEPTSNSNGND